MYDNNILTQLASQGSYFIYDLDALHLHATELTGGHAKLFFACKANPLSHILHTLHETGIHLDVASTGELAQGLSTGIPGDHMMMTGPAKSTKLLRYALENKVNTFVIESLNQLITLQQLATEYGYQPNILLRLQLKWQHTGKSVLGGNQITPFGMDLQTVRDLLPSIKLPLLGFHVFQWGNLLSLDALHDIWQHTIGVCKSLTVDFQVLDVGGGLGIPYQNEQPLPWNLVNQTIQAFKQQHNLKEFWLEPGRYLSGPFGTYITRVVDRKKTYDKQILVLEGGIHHLARPALVGTSFPVQLLRDSNMPHKSFALHGSLCTSLDFLGNHHLPADVNIGDVLVFKQTGAYGFTESMPFFLCHQLPGEAVIQNGKIKVVREIQPATIWLK